MFRLLDLFCGAGGCSVGYFRAGFRNIVGVDVKPMPRYPYRFDRGDAIEYLIENHHRFDAIHASPPCQAYSVATAGLRKAGKVYSDLVATTRHALVTIGKPWVIENVVGSPLSRTPTDAIGCVQLCGSMFGLRMSKEEVGSGHDDGWYLERHRWFEGNFSLRPPGPCNHVGKALSVVGHGTQSAVYKKFGYVSKADNRRIIMGIPWMDRTSIAQAIPPAYTEWIGNLLMAECVRRRG